MMDIERAPLLKGLSPEMDLAFETCMVSSGPNIGDAASF